MSKQIYTIGHSTRSIEDFLNLLRGYGINLLVDIRTIPKSKHNPQYNEDALKIALKESHIKYVHISKLGGLRHTTQSSINVGWHNPSFRGFADYMQTSLFWEGIEELEGLGKEFNTVIMCAEALPWRCHRSLVADALTTRKWKVFHIMNKKSAQLHKLTPFLRVKKGQFIYSDEGSGNLQLTDKKTVR